MTIIAEGEKNTSFSLWQEVIQHAESRCAVRLNQQVESYLISMLIRHMDKPELCKQVFAIAFLEALQLQSHQRHLSLQEIGDQCLIYAGLFPLAAEMRHVKISYFVNLGQSAYGNISRTGNDLFASLALDFVVLMDVLQSTRPFHDLLPLQAYEQWHELGSQRAFKILQEYTRKGGSR